MATAVLALFAVTLLACSLLGVSTVWPLLGGAVLFFGYGVAQGHSWLDMARGALSSVHTVGKILVTFLFIGVLTAMWRASGTIVFIVDITSGMCSGPVILLVTFLLCCLMSFLTGTSFGTAVTMGTICAFIATNAGGARAVVDCLRCAARCGRRPVCQRVLRLLPVACACLEPWRRAGAF